MKKSLLKKFLFGCVALSVFFSVNYVNAEQLTASSVVIQNLFTQEELAKIKEIKTKKEEIGTPKFNGDPFENSADTTNFYQGKLAQGFLKDGENSINYARFLAGLPTIEMTDKKNQQAQYGPLILSILGELNHTPKNPGNIPKDVFSKGYDVTSTSNLGTGYSSVFDFNQHCLNDSDNGNIDRVGHRRWLLSPKLKYVGMGYLNGYCATMVFDSSANTKKDVIMWPAEGVFPLGMFEKDQAWSIHIPKESNYKISSKSVVKVTLTRVNDGKKWIFDKPSNSVEANYFNIETNNYGYCSAVIFRPDVEEYTNGDEFLVKVEGMKDILEYRVKFFDDTI